MTHPSTILYPKNFDKSQWAIICPYCYRTVGFDGIFHWGWVLEAIDYLKGLTKIQPMDFDGVIERHWHYIIFETKDVGLNISQAQLWTLERISNARSFCIMKIWGKENPEYFESQRYLTNGKSFPMESGEGVDMAKDYVRRWFKWADNNRHSNYKLT